MVYDYKFTPHERYINEKYSKIIKDTYYSEEEKSVSENNTLLPLVDCSYPILLDKKSAFNLSKTFKLIRQLGDFAPQKKYILDAFWNDLFRYYNDHKSTQLEIVPEPLHLGYAEDRVVFAGLERLAALATGKSSRTFSHYAIGSGINPVLPSDSGLGIEEARVPISQTGFAESKGSTMQFAGVFPTTIPSMPVSESGIFDRATSPSTMFLRTIYTGVNVINHIVHETYIAISHIVYMISV